MLLYVKMSLISSTPVNIHLVYSNFYLFVLLIALAILVLFNYINVELKIGCANCISFISVDIALITNIS